MDVVTNLVMTVALLLALAAAEDATKAQVKAYSPSATRGASATSARPTPSGGGCDEFGCGSNHNETLVRDAAPMK